MYKVIQTINQEKHLTSKKIAISKVNTKKVFSDVYKIVYKENKSKKTPINKKKLGERG